MFIQICSIFLLTVVFVNAELSFPINGVDQTEDLSKPAEEKVYISAKFEDGPLSPEVQKMNPRLNYIGEINGKSFYYDDQVVSWTGARSFCTNLGMLLGALSNQAEADFVYSGVGNFQLWTSAILGGTWPVFYEFRYESNGAALPNFNWRFFDSARPVMSFSGDSANYPKHFFFRSQSDLNRPLCYV